MNSVMKARLVQFMKTNCRNFHGFRESISKVRNYPQFVMVRKNTTNLMRGPKMKSRKVEEEEEIGILGYTMLGMPIISFALGTWQIQRRQWKLGLIEELNSRSNSPPVDLPLDLSELANMEYRPVRVRGRFLHDKEFTIGPKSLIIKGAGASEQGGGIFSGGRSNNGLCVVTPFEVEGRDLTIMVNRGWVPRSYKKHPRPPKQTNEIVEITGIVRLNEPRPVFSPKNAPEQGMWMYRDLDAMAEYAGTDPVYIELIKDESVKKGPIAGQTRINLRNEHLTYVITWYGLAIITGWMWYRRMIKKLPVM